MHCKVGRRIENEGGKGSLMEEETHNLFLNEATDCIDSAIS